MSGPEPVRRRVPRWALAVAGWVAVVAVASTVAWLMISRAGAQVLDAAPAPVPSSVASSADDAAPAPTASAPDQPTDTSGEDGGGDDGGGGGSGSSGGSGGGSGGGEGGGTGGGGSASTTSAPAPPPAAPPAAQPAAGQSAASAGGQVTASCSGTSAVLVAATPNSGWTVTTEGSGTDRLRVDFRSGEAHSRIQARCSGGTPTFEVEDEG